MGNGDDTAGHRLRLLSSHFRQHPVTGPAGHSYISSEPRATAIAPGLPYDADVVELIDASVAEIAAHTRRANSAASPLPEEVADVYAWCLENTASASAAVQQRRDTVILRQELEHAIAMGDTKVVRPHRCPACRGFGLMWDAPRRRAVCTSIRCLTPDGMANSWTLARLAHERVSAKKSLRVRAT
jgi:hypothetical protein